MSRQVYLAGLGLSLIGVAFAIVAPALAPAPGVTEANVRRIKLGMTLPEVEALLGPISWADTVLSGEVPVRWDGKAGASVVVIFSRGYGVTQVDFTPGPVDHPLKRLRSWLGR
jgi:hypothetical protein